MKYFCIPNLSSDEVTVRDRMDDLKGPTTYPEDKAEFRKWCVDIKTKGTFYAAVEGLFPGERVSQTNPAKLMHGFVADYDAIVDDRQMGLIPENGAPGLLPMWASMTYSGKRRLVWEFEEPVLCDHEKLNDEFLKLLAKELHLDRILPSFDKCSLKQSQYFELGRSWTKLEGTPIPAKKLSALIFKAATIKKISIGTEIPIEEVAEEVLKQFPNRWIGEFVVGARGPLFWIADGIDRVGAQVGDHGMICYSERAGKSFLSWGEILGKKFVTDFETEKISQVVDDWWYIGKEKSYIRDFGDGNISLGMNVTQLQRHLSDKVGANLDPRLPKDGNISEVGTAVNVIEMARQVYSAAPFPFNANKKVYIRGRAYLNTSVTKCVEPKRDGQPDDFPWLWEFLNNRWAKDEPIQRDVFLAWHKRFYATCLDNAPELGQTVFIEGSVGLGKSFLAHKVVGDSVGGHIDAAKFLLNKTAFNEEAGDTGLWTVDDEIGSKTWEEHSLMSAAIKKYTATPEFRMEAKFKDAFTREYYGRILVTCNDTAEGRSILPYIDGSINDKLIFLRFDPDWKNTFDPVRRVNDNRVHKELPYYLGWLLKHECPKELVENSRYGMFAWKHPEMERAALASGQGAQLEEILAIWADKRLNDKKAESEVFTARELLGEFNMIGEIRNQIRSFSSSNVLGRTLSDLHKAKSPWVLAVKISHGTSRYMLRTKPPKE